MRGATVGADDFGIFVSDALVPAYQPIVTLADGETVGYEALARWPGLVDASPDVVFARARQIGRMSDLDWACRLAAMRRAVEADLPVGSTLFVNVEPGTSPWTVPPDVLTFLRSADLQFNVMLEITERSVARHPAEIIELVGWARRMGWGIALDDVGADPASLAMLSLIEPDVIKLDMCLVNERPGPTQASIVAAVMAQAERTGAVILGEGIETEAHRAQAASFGAVLGQGWLFGKPGSLGSVAPPATVIPLLASRPPIPETPFAVFETQPGLHLGTKVVLAEISQHIERHGMTLWPPPVVLSAFQESHRYSVETMKRYEELATRCPLVVTLALGGPTEAVPGVVGAELDPADALVGEWNVVVVGNHYAAALTAREVGDDGPDEHRRFQFAVTHDRDKVLQAARSMVRRLLGRVDGATQTNVPATE